MDTRSQVGHAVEQVTHLLHRESFFWDFIFEKSLAGAALLLTNSEAFRHAVSAAYSDTFSNQGLGDRDDSFDSHTLAEVLFVPAFSTGGISIGAAVTRSGSTGVGRNCGTHPSSRAKCVPASGSEFARPARLGGHSGVALGRFVRDDRSGELLLALRPTDSRDRSLVLLHFAHRSTIERKRTMLVVDGQAFANPSLSMLDAVTCVQETVETRSVCPVCDNAASSGCGCPISLMLDPRGAVHPLDYGAIRATMLSHVGGMVGHARVITNIAGADARRSRRTLHLDRSKVYAGPVFEVRCGGDFVTSPPLVSWMQICGRAQESDAVANEPRVLRHWLIAEDLRRSAIQDGMLSISPTRAQVATQQNGDSHHALYRSFSGAAPPGQFHRRDGVFGKSYIGAHAGVCQEPPINSLLNECGIAIAATGGNMGSNGLQPGALYSTAHHLQPEGQEGTRRAGQGRGSTSLNEAGEVPVAYSVQPGVAPSSNGCGWQDFDATSREIPVVTYSSAVNMQAIVEPCVVANPTSLTLDVGPNASASVQTDMLCPSSGISAEEADAGDIHQAEPQFVELPEPGDLVFNSSISPLLETGTMPCNTDNVPTLVMDSFAETPTASHVAEGASPSNSAPERGPPVAPEIEEMQRRRKMRNRASAARSNRRRKEYNDWLKAEKIRCDDRIVELRIKRTELVTRREMLLSQLSDRNIRVPSRYTQAA